MLQFIALVAAAILISIEQKNRSPLKLLFLSLTVIAARPDPLLRHGIDRRTSRLLSIALRRRNRIATISAIAIAVIIVAAAWGRT